MPEKEDSFRNLNRKEKMATIAGLALLITLVVGFVWGLYFFGLAGVFALLGVQYISIWSLVMFVGSFFILGIFVELVSKVIFKIAVRNMTGKINVFFIRISIEGISNWLVLFAVDEFMNSITLSLKTEILIALLLAIIEIVFDGDKENSINELEGG